ncbi:hypothetical protein NDU88_000277 [Pleurodeles waltl]|uniref:Uncharacterized protein n=1 Tax=Pleurodeles waltl TaxID=8319 RepID=A0AAV7S734_PLEWA|nr:hypothetical protein NDU88_000277 [Pleurodeles waltl]
MPRFSCARAARAPRVLWPPPCVDRDERCKRTLRTSTAHRAAFVGQDDSMAKQRGSALTRRQCNVLAVISTCNAAELWLPLYEWSRRAPLTRQALLSAVQCRLEAKEAAVLQRKAAREQRSAEHFSRFASPKLSHRDSKKEQEENPTGADLGQHATVAESRGDHPDAFDKAQGKSAADVCHYCSAHVPSY